MASSNPLPRGSVVALVTPMHDDGSVDYPALRTLVDWHVAEGTDCIGVVGTTGESPTVDVEEHCEIIRVTVEHAAGRVPVMAGCGANSTAEAIALAQFARERATVDLVDQAAASADIGAFVTQLNARRALTASPFELHGD